MCEKRERPDVPVMRTFPQQEKFLSFTKHLSKNVKQTFLHNKKLQKLTPYNPYYVMDNWVCAPLLLQKQ